MPDAIGWLSSLILVVTIGKQIHKQWHDETSQGVSVWLFAGQSAASAGFTVYSVLVKNWVFVVTNALLLAAGIIGFVITARHRRRRSALPSTSSRLAPNSTVAIARPPD